MTRPANEESRLAAEALRRHWHGYDQRNPIGRLEAEATMEAYSLVAARLESGELVVAPANRVAGEGQVVMDETTLRAIEAALARPIQELQDEQPACNDVDCGWSTGSYSHPKRCPPQDHDEDCYMKVREPLLARLRAALGEGAR
jgi:hypothetical protein